MAKSSKRIERMDPVQQGFWVSSRLYATMKYFVPLRKKMIALKKANQLTSWTPAIVNFKEWVDSHHEFKVRIERMLLEVGLFVKESSPEVLQEITDDGDYAKVLTLNDLYDHLNIIISSSPSFNDTVMVGTPMNGLLAIAMGTKTGSGTVDKKGHWVIKGLFQEPEFNAQLKKVLDSWNTYLKSEASLDLLDINDPEKDGSWISLEAHDAGVWSEMVYDPSKAAYGYDSWNSFFIRQFVNGARPFRGNAKEVINIGCETTPWEYQDDVKFSANFNVKGMPYSLIDIFGGDKHWANEFVGGQIYQGFLSATHYHRWKAPLTGKIIQSWVQPGTYFAQRPGQGEDQGTWEGTESQPYLSEVATRAIFIMKHEKFGYVAMVCIGMVEVSTCHIESQFIVPKGHKPVHIERGDEIGHFEFGGSTHALIFQKDKAKLVTWAKKASQFSNLAAPIQMGTVIAKLP
ncbi:MAG: Phosphatidylserine decarboxylase proenzyme [Candidatus Celerinatantimonas neptuna]|nr:MAG: Phosphatidylserine decarboxylase proenzyme [Candidatus Celerinatantimonas neptuna]